MKQDKVTSKCFSCFSKEGPEASLGNSHDMSLNFFKCITYYTLKYVGGFFTQKYFLLFTIRKKKKYQKWAICWSCGFSYSQACGSISLGGCASWLRRRD